MTTSLAIGQARAKQMRALKAMLVLAVVAIWLCSSGAAYAAKPVPPGLSPFVQTGWEETAYDTTGKVTGYRTGIGPGPEVAGRPDAGAATTADDGEAMSVPAGAAVEGTDSGGSGCKTVRAWVNRYTLLGFLAYRWNHSVYFCWTYPHITAFSPNEYISDNDGLNYLRNVYTYGYWYTWNGAGNGGHYPWRQAQVENCIIKYGCIGTTYPWVSIWINGNGAWAYDGGGT
jgi:hypothetical protein